ncbi:MAG: hypothetical protein LBT31_01705, partial [Synergistaceae bacterium]|nr:hypothetical protein [Synergistaceae bacterium]
ALLCALAFERELGIAPFSSLLQIRGRDFYPWAVRVALCCGMILFDALIVLYICRIGRVYRRGFSGSERPTWPGDATVSAAVILLCVAFVAQSVSTTLKHDLPFENYIWMERAFLPLSNFFYVSLEATGAIALFRVWRIMEKGFQGAGE